MSEKADAYPAKEFFISMLTRDISLTDCILDLLDNSVDGARRSSAESRPKDLSKSYVHLELTSDHFEIRDNCGGIPLSDAKEYAFNFGRRKDAPRLSGESIGIYGIGMKRALFKLGKKLHLESSSQSDSFQTTIDVESWEAAKEWEFDLVPGAALEHAGTTIRVSDLNPGNRRRTR